MVNFAPIHKKQWPGGGGGVWWSNNAWLRGAIFKETENLKKKSIEDTFSSIKYFFFEKHVSIKGVRAKLTKKHENDQLS